ncbi:hypothetical protein L2E82_20450 [Cichorium intybus]|uniref:Uncharacterized protein n=1 Tax=Cichorium intybus TaxID=13427 RepID=A0ACB9DT29_CICIN|nr:hypothetical protein L2E82_20450 [Cichorium intybus]
MPPLTFSSAQNAFVPQIPLGPVRLVASPSFTSSASNHRPANPFTHAPLSTSIGHRRLQNPSSRVLRLGDWEVDMAGKSSRRWNRKGAQNAPI